MGDPVVSSNNPFQIHPASSIPKTTGPKVKDPVCGMEVTPATAAGSFEYRGQTYYFCAKSCLAKFQADPESILRPSRSCRPPGRPRTSSTPARCIPRWSRWAPGPARSAAWRWSPRTIQAEEGENPELVDMRRRFWVSVALSLPLLVISMAMLGPHRCADLDRAGSGDPGGPVGGLAVFRARLAVDRDPQS